MKKALLLLLLVALVSCSDDEPVTPVPHVTTTFLAEHAMDYTSATVRMSTTEIREGGSYVLTRNGLQVWEGLMTGEDTLLTDTGLTASSDYQYRAYALQHGAVVDSSDLLTVHTKDTTSGDFTWEVYTFGDYSSLLRDVCMISPTDVWAVGTVYYNAPDRKNKYIIYNALHWDGVQWDTLQVPTQYAYWDGSYSSETEEELYSVYEMTENDIWFIGEYSGVTRWQNGEWNQMKPPYDERPGRVNGIWGTSNDLVFATWGWGIRGWDGSKFYSIMNNDEIGDVYAQDVWGVDDTALVIAGDMDHSAGSTVYKVVNGQAEVFPSNGLIRNMVSLWCSSTDMIFASGNTLAIYENGIWKYPGIQQGWGFTNQIRGVANNDVIAVGDYSTVLHCSGISWRAYPEIDPERSYHFEAVAYDGKDIWAVGETTSTKAVILHGIRK